MNNFGGKWTEEKIAIFIKYVRAYLTIMGKQPRFSLRYFDGFAGSGIIIPNKVAQTEFGFESDVDEETNQADVVAQIQGVASRVLGIEDLRSFDRYDFIEKNQANAVGLQELLTRDFPNRNANVVVGDCNEKLLELAGDLRNPANNMVRTVAFLDPYGMQVRWESLEALKGLPIDLWILVPTGIGVGRLLKRDGQIKATWMNRLTSFLGLTEDAIIAHFYRQEASGSLFEDAPGLRKIPKATEQVAKLYCQRIKEAGLFEYVAEPRALKNSNNSTMYHFVLCTNVKVALKIANEIK